MANPLILIETIEARDALDTALSMITFDLPVQVVLMNEGVLNAFSQGNKATSKALAMLEMFDAPIVCALAEDVSRLGVHQDAASVELKLIDNSELRTLIQQASGVSTW